jgi:hypothetical protein
MEHLVTDSPSVIFSAQTLSAVPAGFCFWGIISASTFRGLKKITQSREFTNRRTGLQGATQQRVAFQLYSAEP